jgi:hypothetical protein
MSGIDGGMKFQSHLVATNAWFEVEIRHVHFLETEWTFDVLLGRQKPQGQSSRRFSKDTEIFPV